MLFENPELDSLDDFLSWASLAGFAVGFTGNEALLDVVTADATTVTVGEYRALLDAAEADLANADFSELEAILPSLEENLRRFVTDETVPDDTDVDTVINQILDLFDQLISRDFSTFTQGFDALRDALAGLDDSVVLAEAFDIEPGEPGEPGEPVEPFDPFGILDLILPTLPEDVLVGWAAGDPHLQTLDGVGYDFQAVGEYVLLQSADGGDFQVQARMEQAGPNASLISAVATEVDGNEVQIDGTDQNPLSIDGEVVALEDGEGIDVGDGAIFRTGNEYRIVYPGDNGVVNNGDSQVIVRVSDGRVDVDLRLNDELLGSLEGLLGDGDGNRDNDVALADGTPLARPFAFADVYGQYRDDWRVGEAESLFTYDAGESNAGFYDAAFPAAEVSLDTLDPAVRATAEDAAEAAGLTPGTAAFENAVLDFALTGDGSFLESAASVPLVQTGTDGNDVLTGGDGDDNLSGGAGDDRVDGAAGDDNLSGGPGDDGVIGGAGGDVMTGGAGDDNMAAGAGNDDVRGGDGDDFMGGGRGSDIMLGQAGDDTLGGGFGNDTINAGIGDDVVAGGAGDDAINGGAGGDVMGASFGDDTVTGGVGDDDLGGGTGRDAIDAGDGNDSVGGGEGDDLIDGGDGDDFLAGGGRNDSIEGDDGADVINGGDGNDRMDGGDGADVFVWNEGEAGATDVILDFEDGIDSLRLTGVENAPGTGLQGRVDALMIEDALVEGEAGASLTYQGQTILIEGVSAANLTVDDFDFL